MVLVRFWPKHGVSRNGGRGGMVYCLASCLLLILLSASATDWDASQLTFDKQSAGKTTLNDLVKSTAVHYHENTCFFHTEVSIYNENRPEVRKPSNPAALVGTTVWLNEFFAPGHVFFILSILKVVEDVPNIDRIVLQRAPCAREDFCQGIGYYHGFFQGFFRTVMEAFGRDIPLYVRWQQNDAYQPVDLWDTVDSSAQGVFVQSDKYTSGKSSISPASSSCGPLAVPSSQRYLARIPMAPVFCFDKVISRTDCDICNGEVLNPNTTSTFRAAAYRIVNDYYQHHPDKRLPSARTEPLIHYFHEPSAAHPIVILFAYRGSSASRHMSNSAALLNFLQSKVTALSKTHPVEFHSLDTSTNQLRYEAQIHAVSSAHVVISEHGAFQAHMMYLRRASLIVDLQARTSAPQFTDMFRLFDKMMHIFGVFHRLVRTKQLTQHGQASFAIEDAEMDQIWRHVEDYIVQRAYRHNMSP